jgi:hypothetical protein
MEGVLHGTFCFTCEGKRVPKKDERAAIPSLQTVAAARSGLAVAAVVLAAFLP